MALANSNSAQLQSVLPTGDRQHTGPALHPLPSSTSSGKRKTNPDQRRADSTQASAKPLIFLSAVAVALRAHHRRRHQSPEQQCLRPRAPHGGRVGQLPPHHRRDAGAPEELPPSGAHRALRLPAGHQGRHQTHPGQWERLDLL